MSTREGEPHRAAVTALARAIDLATEHAQATGVEYRVYVRETCSELPTEHTHPHVLIESTATYFVKPGRLKAPREAQWLARVMPSGQLGHM